MADVPVIDVTIDRYISRLISLGSAALPYYIRQTAVALIGGTYVILWAIFANSLQFLIRLSDENSASNLSVTTLGLPRPSPLEIEWRSI
jgi:hypothetical protein